MLRLLRLWGLGSETLGLEIRRQLKLFNLRSWSKRGRLEAMIEIRTGPIDVKMDCNSKKLA